MSASPVSLAPLSPRKTAKYRFVNNAQPMGGTSMRERLNSARRRASRAYREAKSLMSSEMEGVVLKATRPDDLPVKPKHLEALMRPTTEMPKEFNVYLPVVSAWVGGIALRKCGFAIRGGGGWRGGFGSNFCVCMYVDFTFPLSVCVGWSVLGTTRAPVAGR